MPLGKGLLAPQNNFLETIATRFDGTHANFVLGNAKGRDYPIVYCSDGFCELTGVSRSHVMGRPCACPFLFGDETAADERRAIDDALRLQTELQTKLVLYRSDGTRFWCLLDIVPIKNDENQVVLFLVSQKDITAELSAAATDVRLRLNSALKCLTSAATSIAADDQRRAEHANNSVSFKTADEADSDGDEDEAESRAPSRLTKTSQGSLWSALTLKRFSRSGRESDADATAGPSKDYLLNRRRSRAVLYHLSDQLGGSKAKNKPMNKLQSLVANQESVPLPPQYKEEGVQNSRWIIPHYGIVRIAWDWLVLICTFYIAILVPYNFAFDFDEAENVFPKLYRGNHSLCAPPSPAFPGVPPFQPVSQPPLVSAGIANTTVAFASYNETPSPGGARHASQKNFTLLRALDVAVEGLFICDILLNFRTTFVSKGGHVIYDGRQIALNYVRGWFLLDLIAALPLEILSLSFMHDGYDLGGNLLKLARMVRLARLLQKIDRYSQYSTVVLALLVSMFALSAHWLACIWYIVGRVELDLQPCNWTWGWINELANRTGAQFGENRTGGPETAARYITALYFTCTLLTSVGFALMHAVVFGNMSAIIQRMYSRRAAYTTRSNDLKDFSQIHRLPHELKQRMLEFFQTMWSINHGIDPNEIMKEFPEELRGDMALHLYRELLATPLFEAASQGCLKKLAYQCVRYRFSTPGEYLLHRGDRIGSLYFICSGSLEILRNGLVVAILGKGDLFGADLQGSAVSQLVQSRANNVFRYSFYIKEKLFLLKTACDVRALTYCDLNLVELEGLCHIMLYYPDFGDTFIEELQDELAYNLLDDESGSDRHSRGSSGRASPTALHSKSARFRGGELDADVDEDTEPDAVLRGRRPDRMRRQVVLGNEPIEEEEELLDSENEYSDNAPEQQCGDGGAAPAEDPTTTSLNQEATGAQLPSISEHEEREEREEHEEKAHEPDEQSATGALEADATPNAALLQVYSARAADAVGAPSPQSLPTPSPRTPRGPKAADEETSQVPMPPPRQRPFRRHETCPTFPQYGDNNLSGQSPAPRYNKAQRQNSSRSMGPVGAHAIKRWRSLETSRMSKSTPRGSRDRGGRPPSPPRTLGGVGGGVPADEDSAVPTRLISPQHRLPNALLQLPASPAHCSPAGSKSGSPNQSQVFRPSAISEVRRELRALGDRVGAIDCRLNEMLALLRQLHDTQQAAPVWPVAEAFAIGSSQSAPSESALVASLVNGGGGRLLSLDSAAAHERRMPRTSTDTSLSSATILYVDDEDIDDVPAVSTLTARTPNPNPQSKHT